MWELRSICYLLGRPLLVLRMFEELWCKGSLYFVDTIHISLASVGSLGWMKRSCIGVREWVVGGGCVEDPSCWGSVHKVIWVDYWCQPSSQPCWSLWLGSWQPGIQSVAGTGSFFLLLPFLLSLWRVSWLAGMLPTASLSLLSDWRGRHSAPKSRSFRKLNAAFHPNYFSYESISLC